MDRLRRALSLRVLLSGWMLVILTVTLVALGSGVYVLTERHLYWAAAQTLRSDAAAGLNRTDGDTEWEGPWAAPEHLEERAQELAENIGSRRVLARVLSLDGRVLGESRTVRAAPGVDLAQVRDVREGFGARRKETMRPRMALPYFEGERGRRWLVLLVPLRQDGHIVAVLQLAAPYRAEDVTLAMLRAYLVFGALAALALGLGASLWLGRSIARPLERLAETTHRIASGDMAARASLGTGRNEVYAVAADFDRMADRLQRAFESQRRFVADASHELKTPLTAVGGLAEVLRLGADEGSQEKRTRALDAIEREVDKMSALVSDLLVLSRTEEAPIAREPVDVGALLRECASGRVEVSVDGAVVALGHRGLLTRVVQNLLDNALKYSPPEGRVMVSARTEGSQAVMQVEDRGVGIAPEDLPHVFDRFYRADPSRTRKTGGSGLGLAIVRAIVDRHEGDVGIESDPGRGTRVTVRLPALLPA